MKLNTKFFLAIGAAIAVLAFVPVRLSAQDFRSTLTGQVTDPSGAVIPGAMVAAVQNSTQTTYTGRTTGAGVYYIPYVLPGLYTVTVTAPGFSTFTQQNVLLQTSQTFALNVKLQVGAATQKVTVTAAPPLIETANGNGGTILSGTMEQQLPLNGRQVYMTLQTTPGTQFLQTQFGSSGFSGTRGWDVTNEYSIGGAADVAGAWNEFSMNGSNMTVMTGFGEQGTWMTAPNVDAVQEVNVMSDVYDTRYGRTGGGVVNIVTKSGTNAYHGDVYEYLENGSLNANTFTNDFEDVAKGNTIQNQYGATFGGPIKKDKIFFFGSFEGYNEIIPYDVIDSVPTTAMRNGDFSGSGYAIFEPSTIACGTAGGTIGNCANNNYVSTEFPNDTIPAADINKSGADIMNLFPSPNVSGNAVLGNYVNYAPDKYHYYQPMGRIDWTLTNNTRIYGTYEWQGGFEFRNSSGLPAEVENGNIDHTRNNQVASLDLTHTFSPTMIGDFKASFSRFGEFQENGDFSAQSGGEAALGLKYPLAGPAAYSNLLPQITFGEDYPELVGNQLTDSIYTNTVLDADFTKTKGRHNIEFGGEWGYYAFANAPGGSPNGDFEFGNNGTDFTQYNPTNRSTLPAGVSSTEIPGNPIADMLLGLPNSGGVDWNASTMEGFPMEDIYAQDNIRVNHRLNVTVGLRYDAESGVKERFDALNRGMCLECINPETNNPVFQSNMAADSATYTSDYINPAEIDPARGILLFAGEPASLAGSAGAQPAEAYNTDWTNVGPRLGFAYALNNKTVIRGGWGWMYAYGIEGGTQTGFSITTPYTDSLNGITPTNYFSSGSPFPSGLDKPTGDSAGPLTDVGADVGGLDFPGRRIPRIQEQSIGIQRALPGNMTLDVKYSGNYSRNLRDFLWLNGEQLPLTGGPVSGASCGLSGGVGYAQLQQHTYNSCVAELYSRQVPNPYYGVVPNTTSMGSSPTVSEDQLLVPDSMFGLVGDNTAPLGRVWYDSGQATLQKRLYGQNHGLSTLVSFTYEKDMQSDGYQNGWPWQDAKQVYKATSYDRTELLSWSGLWDLPWGQGAKYLLPSAHGVLGQIVNNWKAGWIFTYDSGTPIGLDGGVWNTAGHSFEPAGGPTFGQWLYNCNNVPTNCFESVPSMGQANLTEIAYLRNYTTPNLDFDVMKNFQLTESKSLQVRADFFNMTNTPYFGSGPDTNPFDGPATRSAGNWVGYGTVSLLQYNFPRIIQLSAHVYF